MKLSDIPAPTAAFFQPVRNFPTLANDMGITVAFGPEVEDQNTLAKTAPDRLLALQREWIAQAAVFGMAVVIKEPWKFPLLPSNVVGFCLTPDEPNAKGQAAATLKAEFDRLRAIDPIMPIFLSLAGQNITSANWKKKADGTYDRPAEVQAFADYLAVCDIVTVDTYPRNTNATRYKDTWNADAVAKIKATFPGTRVWTWHECNDKQDPPPKLPDVNRGPTPDEIKAGVDAAVGAGADGIGWFFHASRGSWPDRFMPANDRNGVSHVPQYAMVKAIGLARKPAPVPTLEDRIAALAADNAKLQATVATLSQNLSDAAAAADRKAAELRASLGGQFRAMADAIGPL